MLRLLTHNANCQNHFAFEPTAYLTGSWAVAANGNNITYTFPASARRFVRLKVVGP
ncbi:MAG: hypothetical protein IPK22_21525 [Verrucomicrobiaceae bacterium]|nr:hypothetical protein [Verrucomicrobiaceae bacterium]